MKHEIVEKEESLAVNLTKAVAGGIILAGSVVLEVKLYNYMDQKINLDNTIKTQLNSKGESLSTFRATYFNWNSKGDKYYFEFKGKGSFDDNQNIDYFLISYNVSQKQYDDTLSFIEKNNIKYFDTKNLSGKLAKIIKNSNFEYFLLDNVATDSVENKNGFLATDTPIIINVSAPIIKDNKVSYDTCSLQAVKTDNNKTGIVTSFATASYPETKSLDKNPTKVFSLDKDKAEIKVANRFFKEVKSLENIITDTDTNTNLF